MATPENSFPSFSLCPVDEDVQGGKDSVGICTEDEELKQNDEEEQSWVVHRQELERLPVRDRQLDMTEEEEEEREGEGEGEDSESHGHTDMSYPGRAGDEAGWDEGRGVGGEEEEEEGGTIGSYSADLLTQASEHSDRDNRDPTGSGESLSGSLPPLSPSTLFHTPPQSSPPPRGSAYPHLRHLSSEELANVPGIEAETFPESLPESHRSSSSRLGHAPAPHWPPESEGEELKPRASPYPAAISPERLVAYGLREQRYEGGGDPRRQRPSPSPRKTRQRSPGTPRSNAGSPHKAWLSSSPDSIPHRSTQDRCQRAPTQSPSKSQHRGQDPEADESR